MFLGNGLNVEEAVSIVRVEKLLILFNIASVRAKKCRHTTIIRANKCRHTAIIRAKKCRYKTRNGWKTDLCMLLAIGCRLRILTKSLEVFDFKRIFADRRYK